MRPFELLWLLAALAIPGAVITEYFASARAPAQGPAEPLPPSDRVAWAVALAFVGIVTVTTLIQLLASWHVFVDDAFITFRYADNLMSGYGLRWNPQDAPTEGFTNLLFVILTGTHRLVHLEPLLYARALSLLGLAGLLALIYRVARRDLRSSAAIATVAAAAFLACSRSIEIACNGLETMLFAATFFLCFERTLAYYRQGSPRILAFIGIAAFVALLLRPEAVFIPIAITLVILLSRDDRAVRMRRELPYLYVAFGVPTLIYLIWKFWYFGSIVPNPALLKVPTSGAWLRPRGLQAIQEYFDGHRYLLLAAAASLLVTAGRKDMGRLTAAVLVAMYTVFYLRVDPLMNNSDRFLFPVTALLLYLALPIVTYIIGFTIGSRLATPGKVAIAVLVLCALLYRLPDMPAAYRWIYATRNASNQEPEERLEPLARSLALFPGIDKLSIASVDAGLVPYYTRAYHIDIAGLNTRYLAQEQDVQKLSNYIFARHPDLIIYRTRKDGGYVTYGHGHLGDERTWAANAGWDDYLYAGTADQPDAHRLNIFVRRDAPNRDALVDYIQKRVVDYVLPQAPVPLGRDVHS